MNELQQALMVGALAAEAMTPQRVRDLEEFVRRNPGAYEAIRRAIQGEPFAIGPSLAAMAQEPVEPVGMMGLAPEAMAMTEVPGEAGEPGPEPGLGPFGL